MGQCGIDANQKAIELHLLHSFVNRVLAKLIFRFRVKHGMTKACHSQLDWES